MIGDSADDVTKTTSIEVEAVRKTIEIVADPLNIEAYIGMKSEVKATIMD